MSHPAKRQPVQMLEPSYYARAVEFSYRFDTQDADSYATAVMELRDLMAENDALKARVAELQSQVVRIIASKQELIQGALTAPQPPASKPQPG
jgi:hypothetical protein